FATRLLELLRLLDCLLGELETHIAELLERAGEGPIRIEHAESVPAYERPVAGSIGAATRAVPARLADQGLEAPPLEVRIAFSDLLVGKASEGQERGREVEVRAHRRGALPLRSSGRTDGEVDDGRFLERDCPLLGHAVGSVHLPVVAG